MTSHQSTSDLAAIFERLEKVALTREGRHAQDHEQEDPVCVCGLASQKGEEPSEEAQSNGTRLNLHTRLYLSSSNQGLKFAVCPACDPQKNCVLCRGEGRKARENERGEELLEWQPCECRISALIAEELNSAKLPPRYISATFGEASYLHFRQLGLPAPQIEDLVRNQQRVLAFCQRATKWLRAQRRTQVTGFAPSERPIRLRPQKPFLVLMGGIGTGKTYLASAALKDILMSPFQDAENDDSSWSTTDSKRSSFFPSIFSGRFIDFPSLLIQIRDAFSKKSSELDVLKPLFETDVLVIDEFGKGPADNAWQLEKLDDLINRRYNDGKITIITTNYLRTGENYRLRNYGVANAPALEDFWRMSLAERVGVRMYDRIVECAEFVPFLNIQSLRQLMAAPLISTSRQMPTQTSLTGAFTGEPKPQRTDAKHP